jgi:hypothetical protein
MSLMELLLLASSVFSTTYGHGERMCGDVGKTRACDRSAVTASGVPFNPDVPMVAIAAPRDMRISAQYIGLRVPGGTCRQVLLADKMNPRYIGERGFDLSPAAVALLTGKRATRFWSGNVQLCQLPKERCSTVFDPTLAHSDEPTYAQGLTGPVTFSSCSPRIIASEPR